MGKKTTSITIVIHYQKCMQLSLYPKQGKNTVNWTIIAKTSCYQVSDSKIAYSNLQGIFNIRLTSLWDFSVFICDIRLTCQAYMYNYVVVQFHPWFMFYLPLFWGMVMHDNKFEIKFKPRIKIELKNIHQEVELLPTVEVIA